MKLPRGPLDVDIPNAAQPTPGQGVVLDPTGKLPVSVLPHIVTGRVNSDGTPAAGNGFTVVHAATGFYDITFNPVFAATPSITVTPAQSAGAPMTVATSAQTTTGFRVNIWRTSTEALQDDAFHFIAFQTI